VYGGDAHNKLFCPAGQTEPLDGSGYGLALVSTLRFIPTPLFRHGLSTLEMLRISLFSLQSHRVQPERYAKCRLNFSKINKPRTCFAGEASGRGMLFS
jgi:hypothetical protein